MPQSFQKEKPPARINLFLEVTKGTVKKRVELPLRLLVLGDFNGKEDTEISLAEREIININKDNFEDVMKSSDIQTDLVVPDRLSGKKNAEIKVNLEFNSMNSFRPENVAQQVPQISHLLATRNLLQDLRNRVVSMGEFRKKLDSVVTDKDTLDKLSGELNEIITNDGNNE